MKQIDRSIEHMKCPNVDIEENFFSKIASITVKEYCAGIESVFTLVFHRRLS